MNGPQAKAFLHELRATGDLRQPLARLQALLREARHAALDEATVRCETRAVQLRVEITRMSDVYLQYEDQGRTGSRADEAARCARLIQEMKR